MTGSLFTKLPHGAKCASCRSQAIIPVPSLHANFCSACFLRFFETAVQRAMKKFGFPKGSPLAVAVSGGKDSLCTWQVLHDLGYSTRGIHIDLGIEGFSEASIQAIKDFAEKRNLPWTQYRLTEVFGFSVPEIRWRTRRKICSLCGSVKRHMLNRLTIREAFEVLAIGHNLDDEAGRLLGNTVRHRYQYLEKQYPFLPSTHPRLPAKLKPLYRVTSYEIRIYCKLKEIVPLEAQCPLSKGATSHTFKEALDFLERRMPGTKRDFLFTFLDKQKSGTANTSVPFKSCRHCGEPCYGEVCSICKLKDQLTARND